MGTESAKVLASMIQRARGGQHLVKSNEMVPVPKAVLLHDKVQGLGVCQGSSSLNVSGFLLEKLD